MNKPAETNPEQKLEARAQFFKALGHPVRLLILNLVKLKPRHGEELAMILNLNPATISHHLALLTGAGLLTVKKDQYYQVYSPVETALQQPLGELIQVTSTGLPLQVQEDAFRQKVLRTFFRHGRLLQIPAQLKKWQVVLEHVVQEFEPGRRYSEQEVNLALLEFNEDVATLRRGLVDEGLMQREHGVYWRLPPEDSRPT